MDYKTFLGKHKGAKSSGYMAAMFRRATGGPVEANDDKYVAMRNAAVRKIKPNASQAAEWERPSDNEPKSSSPDYIKRPAVSGMPNMGGPDKPPASMLGGNGMRQIGGRPGGMANRPRPQMGAKGPVSGGPRPTSKPIPAKPGQSGASSRVQPAKPPKKRFHRRPTGDDPLAG